MWIWGDEEPTTGIFADGSKRAISDESISRAGTVCLCLTEREYEMQLRHDEMNGMALEECKRLASQHDFVSDNCDEQYEQGDWLNNVFWAEGEWENGKPSGFSCE